MDNQGRPKSNGHRAARTDNHAGALNAAQEDDILGLSATDLAELERKLIPMLNQIRALLGKPAIIVPKAQDYWK